MMKLKKSIKVGINNLLFFLLLPLFTVSISGVIAIEKSQLLEGKFVDIKILDKVSSKNKFIKLKNGNEIKYKDLLIKSLKCKNSEFDDNPEITAYIQVRDLSNKNNNEVFVFNGWMFSSSPSIKPFDHPIYDVWLVKCY